MNSEKVSVNINNDKLAKIDLLVSEGFYSNRSAFINDAVEGLLEKKEELIEKLINESNNIYGASMWFIGVQKLTKQHLLAYKQNNAKFTIKGFGVLYIDNDVDILLFKDTVTGVSNKIVVHASEEIANYIRTIRN